MSADFTKEGSKPHSQQAADETIVPANQVDRYHTILELKSHFTSPTEHGSTFPRFGKSPPVLGRSHALVWMRLSIHVVESKRPGVDGQFLDNAHGLVGGETETTGDLVIHVSIFVAEAGGENPRVIGGEAHGRKDLIPGPARSPPGDGAAPGPGQPKPAP